jgi:hypothetical protein
MRSSIDWSHRGDSRLWYNNKRILESKKSAAAPNPGMTIRARVIDCTVVRPHSDDTKLEDGCCK